MNRIINDNDIFKLIQHENINTENYQTIFMLYQPIIGIEATNLYLTLIQEKILTKRINLDFNHGRLKSLLNISTTQLLVAFQQLEATKLINTYYYPLKSTFIYEIFSPLTADDFFANAHLNEKLLNQLGRNDYERQRFYFLNNNIEITDNYINISQEENTIPQTVSLKSVLNNIYSVQKQEPMPTPIYSFMKPETPAVMKVNLNATPNDFIAKHNSREINDTVSLMQTKSPEEYLTSLTKTTITSKLKMTLSTLSHDFHLNTAVINCLIEYVWFKNNKRLEPNYMIKIAQTFQEYKITNVEDALKHLKMAFARSKKTPQHQFQQESLWTSQITNSNFKPTTETQQTNNNIKTTTMSQEEINNLLKEFDAH
ncbi:DnaD domain protein [Spiroplasma sp. AdecLV25b]|uniref:DnaD domain protein n=1 Tax=Spiroplasma sp. AdecLV25b TaxID=3027162 RepID=UPI0027E000BA|nr:DnaD domain protein [Spiroplasma sp. AdecLV25b]